MQHRGRGLDTLTREELIAAVVEQGHVIVQQRVVYGRALATLAEIAGELQRQYGLDNLPPEKGPPQVVYVRVPASEGAVDAPTVQDRPATRSVGRWSVAQLTDAIVRVLDREAPRDLSAREVKNLIGGVIDETRWARALEALEGQILRRGVGTGTTYARRVPDGPPPLDAP